MNFEYNRLQTFYTFRDTLESLHFTGSPTEFARHGLYWHKNSWTIRCAFCSFKFALVNLDEEKKALAKLFFKNPASVHNYASVVCFFENNVSLYEHQLDIFIDNDQRVELVRIKSFRWFPSKVYHCFLHQQRMAQDVLYFDSRKKAIQCAFCSFSSVDLCLGVFENKPCDVYDPIIQDLLDRHVNFREEKSNINCPFLRGRSKECDIEATIAYEIENVPLPETDSLCYPIFPEMINFFDRQNTFYSKFSKILFPIEWPHKNMSINELIYCGFFFRHVGDAVTCFWCAVTLGEWQCGSVPRFEHFQKSPRCRVALHLVDMEEMVSLKKGEIGLKSKQLCENFEGRFTPSRERTMETENDVTGEDKDSTCVVCLEKKRTILFLNCKHFVCCESCSLEIKSDNCPVCRQSIVSKIKVFL